MSKAAHANNRFKRLIAPALIFLAAAALGAALQRFTLDDAWETRLASAVRIGVIVGFGWTIITLGDFVLKRRMSMLELDVPDNLRARVSATRLDVIRRVWVIFGAVATLAAALLVVPGVRQIGLSLFASAGIAGIALGLAARPMLSNLIAGLQIAFTQPIRLDDAVVVEGEWGWIEEIDLFYVVVRLWDWRRLVVPLSHFIEKPFQNWTRQSASIIGSVFWHVDHRAPIAAMREKLREVCASTELWDGNVVNLQVVGAGERTVEVRAPNGRAMKGRHLSGTRASKPPISKARPARPELTRRTGRNRGAPEKRTLMHAITEIATSGPGLYEFTDKARGFIDEAGVRDGLLTVFVQHTSCSLIIQENADPDVRRDLEEFFRRLVPDGDDPSMSWLRHTAEGPDDMPAHIKAALTQSSIGIPVVDGALSLGTWQGIYLFEHRRSAHRRRVVLHLAPGG